MIYHEYMVIGGGPAGLQLGYFLEKKSRDYLILERGESAGTFFKKFPRHRKLISINKKHMGVLENRPNVDHDEVRLRFDWNSLLSDKPEMRLTEYSEEYFPQADTFVDYLNDFKNEFNLKVQYETEIKQISKGERGFYLIDKAGQDYTCKYLIIATGLSKPNIPNNMPGIELTTGYEEMSMNPDDYKAKSVLVMGKGNSAFETADFLIPMTGNIKIAGRAPHTFAWQSHFVGDLRALNNNYLDTYQLKSLNVIEEWDDHSFSLQNGKIYYRGDASMPFDYVIRCFGWKFDTSIFAEKPELYLDKLPNMTEKYESVNIPNLYFAGTLTQMRDYKKSTSGFVHGFRYTARFLSQIFDIEHHGEEWPIKIVQKDEDKPIDIVKELIRLANESSSIFQLFMHYCYLIVVKENHVEFYPDMPLDHLKNMEILNEHDFMTMTYEYAFEEDDDVFAPFPLYDRYTGWISKFVHPVVRYFPKNGLSIEERLKGNAYGLCICGRWSPHEYLKKYTLCSDCEKIGLCYCGRLDTVKWFEGNGKCHFCLDLPHERKVFEITDLPPNSFYEHHITEDVHNNFYNGKERHDVFYTIPLGRFLRTVWKKEAHPVYGFYYETWKGGTTNQAVYRPYRNKPIQLRFWTFYSYIMLRTPKEEVHMFFNSERSRKICARPKNRKALEESLTRMYVDESQ